MSKARSFPRWRSWNSAQSETMTKLALVLTGGGDTLAAAEKYKVEKEISYISTGGGAFLEFLEGRQLPAVAALAARSG